MQQQKITLNQEMDSEEETFSFQELLLSWRKSFVHALKYWRIILLAGVLGILIGIGFAWIKKTTYTARLTFVVEESKGSGGSIASALAGSIGFDIGNLSGGNGVLSGDNVLELLKSHSLIRKTLLTPYNESSTISIADRYASIYHWKEKWKNNSEIGKEINFPAGQKSFSRIEDSLLLTIVTRVAEKELSIGKPDKKLGFFELQVTTREEKISQLLCERLLKITTDFYVDTKTKRLSNNVSRLQKRADSLGVLLDRKTYSAAETNRLLLDGNPAYSSPSVNAEISSRNKFIQSTVYAEIIKNLEISKTSLIQETPTVQVVDYPELPLKQNKISWLLASLAGGMLAITLTTLFFAARSKIKTDAVHNR